MFRPITPLGRHRKPLSTMELHHLESMKTNHALNEHMDKLYPEKRAARSKLKRLLRIRRNLFGTKEEGKTA